MHSTPLPLLRSAAPATAQEVGDEIRAAFAERVPVYPIGGGTSLNYGLNVQEKGIGLLLANMNQVVDFPARDMTVTVGAGICLGTLAAELAREGQQLPFDVPQAATATVGGIVATNFNGPRRYSLGAIRDYVIGIEAVDGTGRVFHGGGRVVKNVAGYDFCKLLTGSLGTLGVITQLTFKLRPRTEVSRLILADLPSGAPKCEAVLARLAVSAANPCAIEILAGTAWRSLGLESDTLAVRLEGTAAEVAWMETQLSRELAAVGCLNVRLASAEDHLWQQIIEFPADVLPPLVVQAHLVPSGVVPFIAKVQQLAPSATILAHAGQGSVIVKFAEPPPQGFSKLLMQELQPLASAHHGRLVVLSQNGSLELTPQLCWSGSPTAFALMLEVKKQFDPAHLMNRGRFVFAAK